MKSSEKEQKISLDDHKIRQLRSDIPALANQVYVNWGGGGPCSRAIVREADEFTKREMELGSFHPTIRDETKAAQERIRESCAKLIGADTPEIALTNNTTRGINIAAAGLAWNPGDEVIITDLEHPGSYLPWLVWRDRKNIKVTLLKTGKNDADLLQNLENAINPKTRAVCASHIAWLTGRRLPLEAIGQICGRSGTLLVVDGAQSVGQIPVNVKKTGADVYTISGQKWLMGPPGTGAVYIRHDAVEKIHLSSANAQMAPQKRLKTLSFAPVPGAMRYEGGTVNTSAFLGFRAAVEHFRKTGPASVEKRILTLANQLLDQLRAMENIDVITPPGKAGSGLVSFRIRGVEPQDAVDLLGTKHRIILRAVPQEPPAVRASIHYLNTEEEVGRIAAAVSTIAADAKN